MRLLFFIDPIESSSHPATETGYALLYRAFLRARLRGGEVYVAYPDAELSVSVSEGRTPEVHVAARRVLSFADSPYMHYRSQRGSYSAEADVGSPRCHREGPLERLCVNELDAVVWRQESGEPASMRAQLNALAAVEPDTLIYLAPRLALDPRFGSKVIPGRVDPRFVPRSFPTSSLPTEASARERAEAAVRFVREALNTPSTVIAKPVHGHHGVGIGVLGLHPVTQRRDVEVDDVDAWLALIEHHGDVVVQEYIASVRAPADVQELAEVPRDRRDFGEVRFLLIDGEVPLDKHGQPCLVARRVPTADSLIADSGISHATSLSDQELAFLRTLGPLYQSWGIHFGGGDLIRTGEPERPFVFTDAARSVCGHAVVTGALNGEPYLIVDRVLDSLSRHIDARRASAERVEAAAVVHDLVQLQVGEAR
ncbi:MAG: hypothetical protein ABW352_06860 [Polyangiales bacterium]